MSTLSEGRRRRCGCGKSITVLVNVGFSISTIPFMATWLRELRASLRVVVRPSRNVFCHLQYIIKLSRVQIHSFPSDDDFDYPTMWRPQRRRHRLASFGRFTHNGKSIPFIWCVSSVVPLRFIVCQEPDWSSVQVEQSWQSLVAANRHSVIAQPQTRYTYTHHLYYATLVAACWFGTASGRQTKWHGSIGNI